MSARQVSRNCHAGSHSVLDSLTAPVDDGKVRSLLMTSDPFRLRRVLAVAAFVIAVVTPAAAQTPQAASIVGTTTSQGGSVLLPGAHLSLLDATTGQIVRDADSDDRGSFRFIGLRPGSYRVRASLDEFQDL